MSLVVLCAAVVSIYGPSARKEGVVVATSKNFKEEVIQADGPVAVQFFAPWCGHCKALKPAWKAATKALKGSVKLVVVDATSEGQLAAKYQVNGYPSIKVFMGDASSRRSPSTYEGARDEASLIAGLKKMAKGGGGAAKGGAARGGADRDTKNAGARESASQQKRPPREKAARSGESGWGANSPVVELADAASFRKRVVEGDGLWLVAFYAPWCGHCKNLEPEWKQAAARLDGQASLAAVDATAVESVAQEYNVEGYPTIKAFFRGEAFAYEGGRTVEDIVGFAMSSLEKHGVEAEVPQLLSPEQWHASCAKKGALCAVAFLPHILDSGADGRKTYLETLRKVAQKNRRLYSFVWSEAGAQPTLEDGLDRCCAGYPTLAAVSVEKKRFAVMRDAFDEKHAAAFVAGVLRGSIATSAAPNGFKIEATGPWDGKDGVLPEEEPLDAYDD